MPAASLTRRYCCRPPRRGAGRVTYGLGFEAQTGTPQNNCRGIESTGAPCSPNGKTGISPRVLGVVTRNNLFGRQQSASIQGTYGLLEQNINLLYQNPHFLGNRDFEFTFAGGYASSQNVTTYVSSKLETGVRWTQHFSQPGSRFSKANTFVYEFDFRRVKVAPETLQVGPSEIAALIDRCPRCGTEHYLDSRHARFAP